MFSPYPNNLAISVDVKGPGKIAKARFPLRYGKYSVIKTNDHEFIFNLNGEIKFIRGLDVEWPHPAEQLKRTDGNDWVYYTVGDKSGDTGIFSWLGEYYLPCLPYPSNSIRKIDYFRNPTIMQAFGAWPTLYGNLYGMQGARLHPKAKSLISLILKNDDRVLHQRALQLQEITGGRVSVLPPDTRHVDYEIIPLMIADGCLYHCGFCCVKTSRPFTVRPKGNIIDQIHSLKAFYGRNIENYSALFLGNHDALAAGAETIHFAASEAGRAFGFTGNGGNMPLMFLFGSVDSLLNAEKALFDTLGDLPFYTYINIGFESMDAPTLTFLRKPVSTAKAREAFDKMNEINDNYGSIEVTGNFLIGTTLPSGHESTLAEFLMDTPPPINKKGAIYLSPMKDSPRNGELLPRFFELKKKSRLPVYVYLIQRL